MFVGRLYLKATQWHRQAEASMAMQASEQFWLAASASCEHDAKA